MLTSAIVICTKDRQTDLTRCLDSLLKQTCKPDELIVVDSGSDGSPTVVQDFADRMSGCSVVYLRSEPGLTRQRNIGISATTKDIVHFMDDDVVCAPTYLEEVRQTFEDPAFADVLSVGPRVRLNYHPSWWGKWFRELFLLVNVSGSGRMLPSGFGSYTWYAPANAVHPVEVMGGCCCAFRRSVFDAMRFDESLDGYGYMEDLDLTYRVSRLGRTVCNPRAGVFHTESQSGRIGPRRLVAMQIVNHRYVFKKHLPQDVAHRFCFWWSEIGETILRLVRCIRSRDPAILLGALDGYSAILRRRARA